MLDDAKKGILLESGTNEIEIMEFTIDDNLYGINVAKVREIMMAAPVKPMKSGMDEHEQNGVTVPKSAETVLAARPLKRPKIRLVRSGGK